VEPERRAHSDQRDGRCRERRFWRETSIDCYRQRVQRRGHPHGTVAFLVPGGAYGTPGLGSAALVVSGGVATASITVDPNQLSMGDNIILALYSGDNNFDVSSASTTVTVTPPANAAAIAVAITPNPVRAYASTAGVATWALTVTLTELAGVAATLTKFTSAGSNLNLATFFPNGTAIPAHGTLSSGIAYTSLNPPASLVLAFGGTDANGNSWNQQITVNFIAPVVQPEILLSGVPATSNGTLRPTRPVNGSNASTSRNWAGTTCSFFKFLAGSSDLTSRISQYFGTTEIAPSAPSRPPCARAEALRRRRSPTNWMA